MKLGTRLHLGFGGIILVLLGVFFLTSLSLERITNTQTSLASSSQFHNRIANVDSMIERLQRYIILYANTGMSSIYDSTTILSKELVEELSNIRHLTSNTPEKISILDNMQQSLSLLTEQFNRASEDRNERDLLLHQQSAETIGLIEQDFSALAATSLSQSLKNKLILHESQVIKAQKALLFYVTNPDSKHSKSSRMQIIAAVNGLQAIQQQSLGHQESETLARLITNVKNYRKQSAKIFRLTRGYLFIFNGVIAGQASEFSRSSQELKDIALAQRETLFDYFNQLVSQFSVFLNGAAILSIVMGGFFAWFTGRGIIVPLAKITDTLISLSKGEAVEKIPGLEQHNEIGDMARSAQVFKEKNNQTEQLLIDSEQTAKVLLASREDLRRHQENLEQMVYERTQELEETISSLNKTQTQLAKSERMATIGNMVQGVAHELNTPVGLALTAVTHIQSDSEVQVANLEAGKLTKDSLADYLDSTISLTGSMSTSLEKAAQLIKSFKLVSVNEHQEHLQQFNLQEHLNNLLASMRRSIDPKFDIINQMPVDISIESYPGVLYQIYTNLMNNSVLHGFEDRDHGKITISATLEAQQLIITYSDDGVGMDQETQESLYEAFFTTKRARGGTGLGMNIVQALVTDKLHGEILLKSKLGQGTTYIISLPLNIANEAQDVAVSETLPG